MPEANRKMRSLPDPEFAALAVERVEKAHGKLGADQKRILLAISSHSRFLARAAARDPEIAVFPLSNNLKTKTETERKLISMSRKFRDTDRFFEQVRLFKYRRLSQIVYEDICGADFTKTMTAISDLAEAVLGAAIFRLSGETGAKDAGRFCVLGMGKLAGRQLNLSSDIDLVYIYEDNGDAQPFFSLARKLTAALNAATENGFLYRVDLGLRPGGIKSPLATHTEGALQHYSYWGETWERIALMKARPVAGDKRLGKELLGKLEPFIYDKNTDYGVIEDMSGIKRKLSEIRKERDIKLGKGGIREIEFFVQTLQILNGANRNLRDPNTLSALKKLRRRKTVSPEIADILSNHYIFLRKVEHNIQVDEELQTHSLPRSAEKLSKLAKMTGFQNAEEFESSLAEAMSDTANICGELFKQPGEHKPSSEPWEKESIKIWEFLTSGDVSREEAAQSLASIGFKRPEDAIEIIADLKNPAVGTGFRARGLVEKLLRVLFEQALKGGGADLMLANLKRLMANAEWKMSIYPLISAAPGALKLFMKLLSCDSTTSEFLIHNPYYINSVALKNPGGLGNKSDIVRSLGKTVAQQVSYEDKLETVRHFKQTETLKLCVAELEKKTDFVRTGKYLSLLAGIVLEIGLGMAKRLVAGSSGGVSTAKTCVLGMGKLGGGELGYASDLDIILIHDGEHAGQYMKLAQKLIGLLSVSDRYGNLYEIDTTLRPSGNAGMLVTSFEAFKKYHETPEGARLWERQALIKASHCAGGTVLGGKVMRAVETYVYGTPPEPGFHLEIGRLRKRMENELAREDGATFNFKTGRGAMADVEFLVQALQLKHGGKHKEIRKSNTIEALDLITALGIIGKREGKTLRNGYIFLGTLGNLLGIFKKNHGNRISREDFERLAGEFDEFPTASGLEKKYLSTTRAIRKIYGGFFN